MGEPSHSFATASEGDFFLTDALDLLLRSIRRNPSVDPLVVLYNYFDAVMKGNHVACRDMAYISAFPRNRLALLSSYKAAYTSTFQTNSLSITEHHQLMTLICADFPMSLCERALAVVTGDGDSRRAEDKSLSIDDFVTALKIVFYYEQSMTTLEQLGPITKLSQNISQSYDQLPEPKPTMHQLLSACKSAAGSSWTSFLSALRRIIAESPS